MNQFRYMARGLLAVLVVSPLVQARDFSARVSAKSAESDNALKTVEAPIDERQDTYQLTLNGDYDNTYLKAEVNYTGSDERFAEESQERRRYLEGNSMLLLGALTDPVDIQFKHSSTALLGTPDALNISNNQDERESLSIIPRLKKRMSAADLVIAAVDITQTSFEKNNLNDSARSTAQLSWLHQATKVNQFSLQGQYTDIAFDNFPSADYVYSSAVAAYSTELRKLAYSIAAGYNRSEQADDATYTSPTYSFSATYNDPLNSLHLMLGKAITDSSVGSGNQSNLDSLTDGESLYKVDQIERTSASLTWVGRFICDNCTLTAALHSSTDDYVVLADEIKSQGASLGFSYNLSRRSALEFRVARQKQKFAGDLVGRDYWLDMATASYRYEFDAGVSLRFFIEQEERDSDDKMTMYQEKLVGGELTWAIF